MKKSEAYKAAEMVVRDFDVPCTRISMHQFIRGLELVHYDRSLLFKVTSRLYPMIAEYYPPANGKNIERNLRLAKNKILERGDPELLEEVFGYQLRYAPSVGDMLDGIVFYMERNHLWPDEK